MQSFNMSEKKQTLNGEPQDYPNPFENFPFLPGSQNEIENENELMVFVEESPKLDELGIYFTSEFSNLDELEMHKKACEEVMEYHQQSTYTEPNSHAHFEITLPVVKLKPEINNSLDSLTSRQNKRLLSETDEQKAVKDADLCHTLMTLNTDTDFEDYLRSKLDLENKERLQVQVRNYIWAYTCMLECATDVAGKEKLFRKLYELAPQECENVRAGLLEETAEQSVIRRLKCFSIIFPQTSHD